MINRRKKIIAVLPAYQAENRLEDFLDHLPKKTFDTIILVDDHSNDATFKIASGYRWIKSYRNDHNLGYGGNMKRCLNLALKEGADIIVEIHPDGEYDTDGILPAINKINKGSKLVLGNRYSSFSEALNSGMFIWKYPITKTLTRIDNLVLGTNIPDMHQGFRVYSRELLEKADFLSNSDDFLFTFQIIVQAVYYRMKISSVAVSTNYHGSKRGVYFIHGFKYSLATFLVLAQFWLAKARFRIGYLNVIRR